MTDLFEKYRDYSATEFALDDRFIDWVRYSNAQDAAFFEMFLKQVPAQSENLALAKRLVKQLNSEKEIVDEETKDMLWSKIKLQANHQAPVVKMGGRKWLVAAAAAVLIVAVSVFFIKTSTAIDKQTIQTAYGEKKTITLPDNSIVILNAASKIEYQSNWNDSSPREVWIDGEAFFDVVHKNKAGEPVKPSERFIVHLKNMEVEVLGTTFTVNTRRNEEQVVLQSGSVKVALKNKKQEVYLKPGEMLRYTNGVDSVRKEVVNVEEQGFWKNDQLKFSNTSLVEIAKLIEDTYGYKVEINDTALLNKRFDGTLSCENEQILFAALETMLDVKITVQNKTVKISKK